MKKKTVKKNILPIFCFWFEAVVFAQTAEQSRSSQWSFLSSCHYLPSAQLLYKPNKDGCADSTITNHQPLCFATKPRVLDVYSSALQPAFSHLRNAARPHLSLHHPSLRPWHTPLFSLFVWSCLDYWNALLFVGLLTNTIKRLQLGQKWLLSPLSGTRYKEACINSKSDEAAMLSLQLQGFLLVTITFLL